MTNYVEVPLSEKKQAEYAQSMAIKKEKQALKEPDKNTPSAIKNLSLMDKVGTQLKGSIANSPALQTASAAPRGMAHGLAQFLTNAGQVGAQALTGNLGGEEAFMSPEAIALKEKTANPLTKPLRQFAKEGAEVPSFTDPEWAGNALYHGGNLYGELSGAMAPAIRGTQALTSLEEGAPFIQRLQNNIVEGGLFGGNAALNAPENKAEAFSINAAIPPAANELGRALAQLGRTTWHGVEGLAERLRPVQQTEDILGNLTRHRGEAQEAYSLVMDPILGRLRDAEHLGEHGGKPVYQRTGEERALAMQDEQSGREFLNLPEETIERLPTSIRNRVKAIIKNPSSLTAKQARSLWHDMGEKASVLSKLPESEAMEIAESLSETRRALLNDTENMLERENPIHAGQSRRAREHYHTQAAPYEATPGLQAALRYGRDLEEPQAIRQTLEQGRRAADTKLEQEGAEGLENEHPLSQAVRDLTQGINQSDIWNNVVSSLGLGAAGNFVIPGFGASAAALGPFLGRYLGGRSGARIIQNPEFQRFAEPGAEALANAIGNLTKRTTQAGTESKTSKKKK